MADERYEARVNRAIALVDAHPEAELSLEALAEAACLSPHHFHRIFKALSGETVHGFTTRLRMERAVAMARLEPGLAWKRIAGRCGYRSMPVFSRAFRRHFGVNPAAFDLEAYWANRPDAGEAMRVSRYFLRPAPAPPDDFRVEIVERHEARLAVSRARGGYVDPGRIVAAYEKLVGWAEREGLPVTGGRLSGASRDDPEVTPLSRCRYEFALEIEPGIRPPDGIGVRVRPAGRWAATAVEGPFAEVDRAWNLLFKSWLPAAGLALRNEPAEEVYRRVPAEIGWERFDLLCCVPIE
ncbi:MAG TPA: AraC family transcriptional regulator [Allosphingosinicella sp.]